MSRKRGRKGLLEKQLDELISTGLSRRSPLAGCKEPVAAVDENGTDSVIPADSKRPKLVNDLVSK